MRSAICGRSASARAAGLRLRASFFFTLNAAPKIREAYNSDTSRSFNHLPYYAFGGAEELLLPKGCVLVGVELTDDAVELPRFSHPSAAAYVLGRERGSLFFYDLTHTSAERAIHAVVNSKDMLDSGFTTIRDIGNAGMSLSLGRRSADVPRHLGASDSEAKGLEIGELEDHQVPLSATTLV